MSPVTVQDVAGGLTKHVMSPGMLTASYSMMGDVPVSVGAVHETTACALPAVAETAVGVPGVLGANGTTALLAAEAGPAPASLEALTVNVYDVPFASPVTVHDVAGAITTHVFDAGELVTS